jgi:hypothetical protein
MEDNSRARKDVHNFRFWVFLIAFIVLGRVVEKQSYIAKSLPRPTPQRQQRGLAACLTSDTGIRLNEDPSSHLGLSCPRLLAAEAREVSPDSLAFFIP